MDEVFKSDKGLKPKPPKKSRKGKKSPKKKKSEYQIFVSKKLQEYKKLYPNMAQKDKFKKIGKRVINIEGNMYGIDRELAATLIHSTSIIRSREGFDEL